MEWYYWPCIIAGAILAIEIGGIVIEGLFRPQKHPNAK